MKYTYHNSTNKFGKQNKDLRYSNDGFLIADSNKRLLHKSYQQFNLYKLQAKQLYTRMKTEILPEKQKSLEELVKKHKKYQDEKANMKVQNSKSIELKGQLMKLQKEKEKSQKCLSQIVDKNLQIVTQIQLNLQLKYALEIKNKQLQQEILIKKARISQMKENNQQNLQKSNIQREYQSEEYEKIGFNQTKNDSQVDTIKKFLKNAQLHKQELQNCLSSRLLYLIQLKENIKQKEAQIKASNDDNSFLQDKISLLASKIQRTHQQNEVVLNEIQQAQFQFNSIESENIELKARLEILQHSLKDQINQVKSVQKNIEYSQNLADNSHSAEKQTSEILNKIIAIKLESQYLESRLKLAIKN